MKVFLAGATGALGRWLVPLLREHGHEVTGLTRSPEKRDALRRAGATPVVADALDEAAVIAAVALAEPDVVVHQLTDLWGSAPSGASRRRRRHEPPADGGNRPPAGRGPLGGRAAVRRPELRRLDPRGPPGVYNVVDYDPAPVAEWLPAFAATIGAKPPRRVPAWLGRLMAGPHGVAMLTEARGASNAKAKRLLDWRPAYPSWREGFRDGLAADRVRAVVG